MGRVLAGVCPLQPPAACKGCSAVEAHPANFLNRTRERGRELAASVKSMQRAAYAAGAPCATGAPTAPPLCDLAPCMRHSWARLHPPPPLPPAATFLAAGQPCPARQLLGSTRPLLTPALPQRRFGAARRAGQPAARLAAVRSRGRPLTLPCRAGSGGSGRDVLVKFTLQRKLKFGEVHKLVGSHPSLGNWKASWGLVGAVGPLGRRRLGCVLRRAVLIAAG